MSLTVEDIVRQPRIIKTDPHYINNYMGARIPLEYSAIFQKFSWNNRNYDYGTFHTVFGASMKFVRFYFGANFEDVRFHTHIFAPTSTGKSRAFSAAFEFAKALGLKVYSANEITTAALVGTIDKEQNNKIIYGAIMEQSGNDIIGMEEASILYNKNQPQYAQDILKILQSAMNPYRSTHNFIRKKLSVGEVAGHSFSSYLFATYPPPTLSTIITETGFLQRLFTIYRTYGDAIRRANEAILINSLGNKKSLQNLKPYFTPIIKKILFVKKYYESKSITDDYGFRYYPIDFTDRSKKVLMALSKKFESKYAYSYGSVREQLANFRTRYMINTIKIAVHHALLRLSDTVDIQDVSYAQRITLPEFDALMFFIESSLERNEMDRRDNEMYKKILNIYKNMVTDKFEKIKNKLNEKGITKKSQFNKNILTEDERLALDYWIPLHELSNEISARIGIGKNSASSWLKKFTLDLEDRTDKREIQKIIAQNPQARFVQSNRSVTIYIRAVKNLTNLPILVPSMKPSSMPTEIPSHYKFELHTPDVESYISGEDDIDGENDAINEPDAPLGIPDVDDEMTAMFDMYE